MAVKKATSRTRSTTKRAKTTRSATTKRATKATKATKARKASVPIAASAPSGPVAPIAPTPALAEPIAAAPATVAATGERPSRFTGDHYLHATGPEPGEGIVRRPGKWLIFVSRSRIDALWDQVRRAVKAGRLGHAAKVSTALPNPLSPDPKKHIICVYTADEDNAVDVRRVREGLRQLGVTWKIPYKSDAATRDGQFEVTAGGPAAKYYE
ncbi:MAG: DUF1917 domain-containing protein [Gemmatimonadota bacterium]|nr:DUF1917 domain-containing protein [Gemmatimonadota bacterium]